MSINEQILKELREMNALMKGATQPKKWSPKVDDEPLPYVFNDLFKVLPFIDRGWKWEIHIRGRLSSLAGGTNANTIKLKAGANVFNFPKLEHSDYPNWVLLIGCLFDHPFGTLHWKMDDWDFTSSPYFLDMVGSRTMNIAGHWRIGVQAWAPITPYGPMYGLIVDPIQPIPLTKNANLSFYNPAASPRSEVELLMAALGRVWIHNPDEFYEDLQRFKMEQILGRRTVK